MAMAERKVIAVCGATGKQGGAVVDALLARGRDAFVVRALVRRPDSAKAKALAARAGVEVVAADFDNADSTRAAMRGAHGAFVVTNYWDTMDASREAAQAATLVEACKAASLSHVVWSTLEDTRAFERPGERMPALGPAGQYCVPHFDEKGAADAKWRAAGVPTTFLRTSFFFENFLPSAGMGLEPRRDAPGGPLLLRLPMARARLSGIAVADIGGCAAGCFLDPKGTVNATIGIAGDHLTGDEYASVFTKVLGKEVKYEAVDFEAFRARGGDAMRDMANMFQFYVDFESVFVAQRDVARARALHPGLQTFEAWLRANADAFKDI